jgi:hypothetical protein
MSARSKRRTTLCAKCPYRVGDFCGWGMALRRLLGEVLDGCRLRKRARPAGAPTWRTS